MPNIKSYFDSSKDYLYRLSTSARDGQLTGVSRMLPGFILALLIGFAITWIYISISSRSEQPGNLPDFSSSEQIQQSLAGSEAGTESVNPDPASSNADYVPEVKNEVGETASGKAWSPDSFLDVVQDPKSSMELTAAVSSAAKQATRTKDPYLQSLVSEAENLRVLPTDLPTNATGKSDQAAFDGASPASQFTGSSSIRFTPDGLILVQPGDSLSLIAQALYGDAFAYNRIFDENRDILNDPNEVEVGAQLRIPGLAK